MAAHAEGEAHKLMSCKQPIVNADALLGIMIEVYLLYKTAHPLLNAQFAMLEMH